MPPGAPGTTYAVTTAARGARRRLVPAKAVRRSQHAPADLTGHSHTRFCRATRAGTSPDSQPARPSPPTASMNDLSPNRGARVKNPTVGACRVRIRMPDRRGALVGTCNGQRFDV